jgi:ribonuclease P protein component
MPTRVGLVVPRFRQTAVARNRVKRRLRELSRIRLLPLAIAADVVIRIRPEAYRAPYSELASDFNQAVVQLSRWRAALTDASSQHDQLTSDSASPPAGDT